MPIPVWKTIAATALGQGESISLCPTGTSMQGILESGTEITLIPAGDITLHIGDIVLAEIPRKTRSLLVLHKIWEIRDNLFLIGNAAGRFDGWIPRQHILGKVQSL